ncbi:MAG: hypothetical protein ACUVSD_05490, partial [Thiobacillaceae bacterium]
QHRALLQSARESLYSAFPQGEVGSCGRPRGFALPFRTGETFGGLPLKPLLTYLQGHGVSHPEGETRHWIEDGYPANGVCLRAVADGNFTVIDVTGGRQAMLGGGTPVRRR